jgi:peptidoglycan/LPS O-acetylase OafA/YrhL
MPGMGEKLSYRADIDGLRAVAVLLVVGFHAFPRYVPAGFVGVDIFFVISGYLISSIITQNLEAKTFSFFEFYSRRIKRIFPGLILVLAFVYIAGWRTLFADEFRQLGGQTAGGAGFFANLWFWRESGYFSADSDTKPLLHLWSLGIEEQFYILWPPLLWVAHKTHVRFFHVVLTLCLLSFAISVYTVNINVVRAFYSPQTRFWELLIGAALIFWPFKCNSIAAPYISTIGAALILCATALLSGDSYFPGVLALVPTAGAALLIAGEGTWINRNFLSHPYIVFVGLISYPLYLWHWPILSLGRILDGQTPGPGTRLLMVLLSFGLAWLTYRFVEIPIRNSKNARAVTISLVAGCFVMFAMGCTAYLDRGFPARNVNAAFLKFDSRIVGRSRQSDNSCKLLMGLNPIDEEVCLTTSADPSILFYGDSHAMALFSSIYVGQGELANKSMIVSGYDCMPYATLTYLPTHLRTWGNNCTAMATEAIKVAGQFRSIRTVIVATRMPITRSDKPSAYFHNGTPLSELDAFTVGNSGFIEQMQNLGKRVIFVMDVPTLKNIPSNCERRLSFVDPRNCDVAEAEFSASRSDYIAAIQTLKSLTPALSIFDAAGAVCLEGYCRSKSGGDYLYIDDNHLSVRGSEKVISRLSAEFGEQLN